MRHRQLGFGKKRSRKSFLDSPLIVGAVFIIVALVIVSGSRLNAKKEYQYSPSYGSQVSAASNENKEVRVIRQSDVEPGTKIDEFKGVAVYSNGTNYMSSHGLNFSDDGYYYGYKWQCVEFVKRYYYEKFGHKMPDGAGNAKWFFNPMIDQGEYNEQRGLLQYENGGDVKPKVDDLLVFTDGAYGHVAIISEVGDNYIEVVQQNSEVPRERLRMKVSGRTYTITGEREPSGWLRLE